MLISELEKRIHESIKGAKKNRVVLEDYDVVADVRNRLLLSEINQDEFGILEEILYSPLSFSLDRLAENVDLPKDLVRSFVERFAISDLYTFDGKTLNVNKDKRKYFEVQLSKFEEEFAPGMEFLQNLLKNIPIHVLPTWYQIPRSSNNIFESIVEKYLHTPKLYQRYLIESSSLDTLTKEILTDLEQNPNYKLYAKDVRQKYDLSEEALMEILIGAELNFLFSSYYEPHLDGWLEVITLFAEWREYLLFLKNSKPASIESHFAIELKRNQEYAFIEDMSHLLRICQKEEVVVSFDSSKDQFAADSESSRSLIAHFGGRPISAEYVDRVVNKLLVLGLAVIEEEFLTPTEHAEEWISMPIEKRTHITFKHPHNYLDIKKISSLSTEKSILEIQKSMSFVANSTWVYFSDFIAGCPIELSDEKKIVLKKQGKNWTYALPIYSEEEKALIRYTIMEWFFESGIVQSGLCNGRDCFKLTHLGRSLFT